MPSATAVFGQLSRVFGRLLSQPLPRLTHRPRLAVHPTPSLSTLLLDSDAKAPTPHPHCPPAPTQTPKVPQQPAALHGHGKRGHSLQHHLNAEASSRFLLVRPSPRFRLHGPRFDRVGLSALADVQTRSGLTCAPSTLCPPRPRLSPHTPSPLALAPQVPAAISAAISAASPPNTLSWERTPTLAVLGLVRRWRCSSLRRSSLASSRAPWPPSSSPLYSQTRYDSATSTSHDGRTAHACAHPYSQTRRASARPHNTPHSEACMHACTRALPVPRTTSPTGHLPCTIARCTITLCSWRSEL